MAIKEVGAGLPPLDIEVLRTTTQQHAWARKLMSRIGLLGLDDATYMFFQNALASQIGYYKILAKGDTAQYNYNVQQLIDQLTKNAGIVKQFAKRLDKIILLPDTNLPGTEYNADEDN